MRGAKRAVAVAIGAGAVGLTIWALARPLKSNVTPAPVSRRFDCEGSGTPNAQCVERVGGAYGDPGSCAFHCGTQPSFDCDMATLPGLVGAVNTGYCKQVNYKTNFSTKAACEAQGACNAPQFFACDAQRGAVQLGSCSGSTTQNCWTDPSPRSRGATGGLTQLLQLCQARRGCTAQAGCDNDGRGGPCFWCYSTDTNKQAGTCAGATCGCAGSWVQTYSSGQCACTCTAAPVAGASFASQAACVAACCKSGQQACGGACCPAGYACCGGATCYPASPPGAAKPCYTCNEKTGIVTSNCGFLNGCSACLGGQCVPSFVSPTARQTCICSDPPKNTDCRLSSTCSSFTTVADLGACVVDPAQGRTCSARALQVGDAARYCCTACVDPLKVGSACSDFSASMAKCLASFSAA